MMPGSIKEMSAFPEEDEVLLIPFELFQKKQTEGGGGFTITPFISVDDQALMEEAERKDEGNI